MVQYWPNKQSINLNNAVVDLFINTENKLFKNLSNKTNEYLYIDIINSASTNKLLHIIIDEFKKLILELVELNLSKNKLREFNRQILIIFIKQVYNKFKSKMKYTYEEIFILSNDELTNSLLIYLLLGSSYIDKHIFLFDPLYTPYKHIQILFENFIITISNIILKIVINELHSLPRINNFFKVTKMANKIYISGRSIAFFLNNLKLQHAVNAYIYDAKSLYSERKKVLIISSKGIIKKYISISQLTKLEKLSQLRLFFLFWLEIKDLFIPKIENLTIQVGKYIIYFSINLLSNIILILIKIIIFYLQK
uniref:Ycf55 n=1 Tax=Ophidocladus simpliciusculus TaxID=1261574 RepID=A0A1Z1MJI6_9FLOR|nr:hypothetical protein [Ophidocladus simpliciusculus]ARW65911.1 hypothetical protein [Ophidocladus simpliciusculus]